MVGAGRLDRRLSFERRTDVADGYGNQVAGDWTPQFTDVANRKWLRGGEDVMAARLESRQPAILTMRNSTQARQVTADWRAVDTRSGEIYNIREDPKESDSRGFLEMLVESGVAV
jgi:head-tail adaptor